MTSDIDALMLEDYQYPPPEADNFQEVIYSKREFHVNKIYQKEEGDRLEQFRAACTPRQTVKPTESQIFVSKFISPRTPYRGLLLFQGTGVGKTLPSILCAEKFKPYVEKYGNRIHVLVPGALNKENYISEIIKATGETYLKDFISKTDLVGEEEKVRMYREAVLLINQYYRIMSHRSFVKRVIGEKIKGKVVKDGKIKVVNRRGDDGEVERVFPVDRIFSLDNTLIVVDEAHGFTGNEYGEALRHIMNVSHNLKILLLSATPMKDSADSIVELINYIRPRDQQMERDKVFTSQKSHHLQFKPGGKEYLRKMSKGYVSYLRGQDPLTFAKRHDMGEIPPGLDFTKVIRCFMKPFQLASYDYVIESQDDSFDRVSGAVSNFVWPGLKKEKLTGFYGIQGMYDIKNQLRTNPDKLTNVLSKELVQTPEPSSLMYLINNNRTISGDIYLEEFLDNFSVKFHTALTNINDAVYGKRGAGLVFVYSNLRQCGVELYQEVLKMNGYLEYQDSRSNYILRPNTKCYFCGRDYGKHNNLPKNIPEHDFRPATFIMVTGRSEDTLDQIPEEKFDIINNVFAIPDNSDGKHIKIILGSKVMSEGITLANIQEIHVLDVHYNLGRVDQVIGRGIRFCKHYAVMNEDNLYPEVKIFKYVVSLKKGLSTEEELYRKAEVKYKLVKETERILMESAVDCPLNLAGNIFREEQKKWKDCGSDDNPCPAICGYRKCQFKCSEKALNAKYYDKERGIYKSIAKKNLDYRTYDISMASEEVDYAKDFIKKLYQLHHVYTLPQILKATKKSYPKEKKELFDKQYVYQGLDQLLPISENDFNNFQDTITDKFNRPGYLIYRGQYYLFQPFDENEDLPMFYRQHYRPDITNRLDIKDFMAHSSAYQRYRNENEDLSQLPGFMSKGYDFDSVLSYYDARDEFDIVGIIDKESLKKRVRNPGQARDEFKIRGKRPKVIQKKRETGLPSFKGSACTVSKDRDYLANIARKLGIDIDQSLIRQSICEMIRNKLFDMEKYSTNKDGNKMTYLIIPSNHPSIPFPLNLEDRVKHIIEDINTELTTSLKPKIVSHSSVGMYPDITYRYYDISFDKNPKYDHVFEKYGGILKEGKYVIKID